jgi:hypothetical protein
VALARLTIAPPGWTSTADTNENDTGIPTAEEVEIAVSEDNRQAGSPGAGLRAQARALPLLSDFLALALSERLPSLHWTIRADGSLHGVPAEHMAPENLVEAVAWRAVLGQPDGEARTEEVGSSGWTFTRYHQWWVREEGLRVTITADDGD